jgi:tRNA pseudouridine55 synthase
VSAGLAARSRWHDVDGIVLLDKPPGMSSNQALQRVRRRLCAAKGGHAGTLDPMATGMLPLCFGHATKACGQLLGSAKCYRATLRLGSATDTGDAEGSVIREAAVPALDERLVESVLAGFVGDRQQVPPMYSALKRDGRPLYQLARAGLEVVREARQIHIDRLRPVALAAGDLEFEVVCSKGTYVRVLGEEIAAALGTCGHLVALRRVWVAPFASAPMVTLDEIERSTAGNGSALHRPEWLQPVDLAFRDRPRIELDPVQALHLRQGRVLRAPQDAAASAGAPAYGPDGGFLGLVTVGVDGSIKVERLFVSGAADSTQPATFT